MNKKSEGLPSNLFRAYDAATKLLIDIYEAAETLEYDKKKDGIKNLVHSNNSPDRSPENDKYYCIHITEITREELEAEINRINYADAGSGVDAKDSLFQNDLNRGK